MSASLRQVSYVSDLPYPSSCSTATYPPLKIATNKEETPTLTVYYGGFLEGSVYSEKLIVAPIINKSYVKGL